MKHCCHFPGCEKEVPPALWGCKPHWKKLPRHLRQAINATYRPGQEIDKNPSRAYIRAAQAVRDYCMALGQSIEA